MASHNTSVINRRQFARAASGMIAGLLLPAHILTARARPTGDNLRPLFASACRGRDGRLLVIVFDAQSGEMVRNIELPERGHGIAMRPGGQNGARRRELVTFARRPGNFAVVFDLDQEREPLWLTTRSDRHFFGHGIFSNDGRLLYTTENDFESGQGVIGVRDATDGYNQVGEFPSGGIDPHELALLSDGRTIVIANGGIRTHPDEPRLENDTATMQPSLAYVDSLTGDVLERHQLKSDLHKLSIRHLCVGADDAVVFGCQYRGPPWEVRSNVGWHRRGHAPMLLGLPNRLDNRIRNYIGSVGIDRDGKRAVATAPHGGLAVVLEVSTGRYLSHHEMPDVYGVAPQQNGFLLTADGGGMASIGPDANLERNASPERDEPTSVEYRRHDLASAWDNHLLAID